MKKEKKKYKERTVVNYEVILNHLLKIKKDSLFFDVLPSLVTVLRNLDIVDDLDKVIKNMPLWFINRIKQLSSDKTNFQNHDDILNQINMYIYNTEISLPRYDEKGFFIDIEHMIIADIYKEDFNFKKIVEICNLITNQNIYDVFVDYHLAEIMKYAKPSDVQKILKRLSNKVLIDIIEDCDDVNNYLKKHDITIV